MSAVLVDDDARAWRQFICRACGYVYDEKDGDPDGGLAPGTRYEDIPDDWACPLCGVSKTDFDPYDGPSTRPSLRTVPTTVSRTTRTRNGVVIVGGGMAGWSTARALRARNPDIPITLVASDSADVYPKPGLSLAFGQRKRAPDLVASFGQDVADDLSIRLVPRAFVTAIDARGKRLRTTRGVIRYDALVLAMGARPVETPAMPSALCWRINSLETWSRLDDALQGGPKRIAVIGAGLVGCELADDLAHAGHAVAVFDPAARPLAAWASPVESQRLLDGWTKLGVRFMPSTKVTGMERRSINGRSTIVLHHDEAAFHDVDIVISAIGLCIDRRLAATAGLAVDAGIAVDAKTLATSVPSIYATGDCISIDGKPCRFIEPIARQAEAIAAAILQHAVDETTHRAPLVRLKTRSAPMTLSMVR